jgi:uncharacterized BrkB/YihY/UPF0761 family membrane protein
MPPHGYRHKKMATLTTIGMVILIIIGIIIIVLLGAALRLLLTIYGFFQGTKKGEDEEKGNRLLKFVKSAGVMEIIFFLLRNRGRFRR